MSDFGKFCVAFAVVVGVILAGGFGFKIGHNRGFTEGYNAVHPSDTIFVIDTHYVDRPVEVIKYKDKERLVYVPITDTLNIHDTSFVVLPREVKVYSDSTYRAQVSGVEPSLDWIQVFQKTAYINNYIEKSIPYDWTLSAFAEGGYSFGFVARAGLEYNKQIAGPLRGFVKAGYAYGTQGKGVFAEGGIELNLFHK